MVFAISAGFFVAGWIIAATARLRPLSRGYPADPSSLFHLASSVVFLAMALATRRGVLPAAVLQTIDAAGTVLGCWLFLLMAANMPTALRPDLMAVLVLLATLLYRAALVPSDVARTVRISVLAVAPVPFATYAAYAREPSAVASPGVFTVYAALWSAIDVLLPAATSRVIYGLRQTVKEARRLGQYTLVEKIGEGGMGVVYRARHALLRRPTAIKLLPPERAGQIDLARFEREVQLTSLLTSPHTVSIYDYGHTPDGIFYYAMEYLDGIDLEKLVCRDGPLTPDRVVHILEQVCGALEEAHRAGLIHRDIKPANILLCERGGVPDFAKVVDFGLVKSVKGASDGVTVENTVPGTPHYMSPEALTTPDSIDGRSDLYALGAVAYFLLTGQVVFGGSAMQVFGHQLRSRPVPPSKRLGRRLPAKLEALVLAALAKEPDERPESARAFRDALLACDDVPSWDERRAAAWWRDRGAALRRARPEESEKSAPRTLVVDLAAKGDAVL